MRNNSKPRAKWLNDILMGTKSGAHDEKAGKRMKRSKAKKELRNLLKEHDM